MTDSIPEDVGRYKSRDEADAAADMLADLRGGKWRVYKWTGHRRWLVSGDLYWDVLEANPQVEYIRTAYMEVDGW